jgi:hypothetical protein
MGLIPPLNGLRLFEAAARCGSFKLAAQELNVKRSVDGPALTGGGSIGYNENLRVNHW